MSESANIDELLQAPPSPEVAQQLVQWANQTRSGVARGDMMLGILSADDAEKIPAAYQRAVDCGSQEAVPLLAWWHVMPQFGEQNLDSAESVLQAAIEQGVRNVELELVKIRWFFKRESASEASRNESFQLVSKLVAEQPQHAEALYFLALLTTHGFGTPASPEAGFELQRQSAEQGYADAMFELFIHYASGLGVEEDQAKAYAICERAAEAGNDRAMYNLGVLNAMGQGTPKNTDKAVHWYERSAEQGNPSAMASLAVMYATGEGVETDRQYAEELLGQADYCGLDVSGIREDLGL